ncbi:hypothetical protein Bbelb_093740, partial [Branchiostoma belcheri]
LASACSRTHLIGACRSRETSDVGGSCSHGAQIIETTDGHGHAGPGGPMGPMMGAPMMMGAMPPRPAGK